MPELSLEASLAAIGAEHGYDWHCCSHFTSLAAMGLERAPGVISNFAKPFSDHYDQQNYLEHDSITQILRTRPLLVHWTDAERRCGRGTLQKRMYGEAREFNIQDGVSFSYAVGPGQFFGVSLARSTKQLIPLSPAAEHHLLIAVYGWMHGYYARHNVCAKIILTEKEQQVLRELIDGHANKVIARAVGSSPRTVKKRIAAIGRKLPRPTQNRTEIVSQTLQIGLAEKYALI